MIIEEYDFPKFCPFVVNFGHMFKTERSQNKLLKGLGKFSSDIIEIKKNWKHICDVLKYKIF